MATVVQRRRGTAAQHTTFTGAQGEITIKTDTNEIVVHDGTTQGGWTGGGFLQAGSGAVPTPVQAKLREFVSVKDFGAVGDGITNDTAAITAAAAQSPYFAPPGTYVSTGVNFAALSGRQYGFGQVETADGNKSAPNFALVTTAPTSFGNENSILTAFNGDMSKCQFAVGHLITGAATLGQPTTGYLYRPEAMPHYTYMFNESGWNELLNGNEGRTGVAAYRTVVNQYGQGDAVCYNGSVFITGTKAGSTNFLANPAGVLFNGDMSCGADGVYMNPYETILHDNGFDVAAIGIVNNFNRTNATGGKSAVWIGYRAQSVGPSAIDSFLSATGKWQVGLDFAISTTDFGTNQAAISLKAGQRIYFNNAANALGNLDANWRTTVFNGDFIEYSGGALKIAAGGNVGLQVSSAQLTASLPLVLTDATPSVSAGQVGFGTSTTVTANAGAISKPAGYAGYLTINIGGSFFNVPYYNP